MFLEKIIKYLLISSLVLPLVFVQYTMYPWNFGKTVYFQILIDVLLILASLRFVRLLVFEVRPPLGGRTSDVVGDSTSKRERSAFRKLILLDWLVLAFLASQIISAFFGFDFHRSFWSDQSRATGVFTYIHFTVFYFLLRYFLVSKKDWINTLFTVISVAFLSSIVAWLGGYFSFFEGVVSKGGRISGLIGGSIFFGVYIVIPVFLSFALFFWLSSKENKDIISTQKTLLSLLRGKYNIFLLIAGVVFIASLIFSFSRGSLLGLLAGGFIVWLFFAFLKALKIKLKNIILASGLIFLVLFSTAYVVNQKTDFFYNISPEIKRVLDIRPGQKTAITRLMAWQAALKGFLDDPILGSGPENFQDVFDKHYNPEFLKYSFSETVWDKPHNYPLEVLSGQGAVGVIIYLALIACLLHYLWRLFRDSEDKNTKLAVIILIAGVFAYIVQLSFLFETINSLILWYLLLAFTAFLYESYKGPTFVNYKGPTFVIGGIFVSAIILSSFSIYQNYLMLKNSYYMSLAEDAHAIDSKYWWKKYAERTLSEKSPFLWEDAVFLTKDISFLDGSEKLDSETLDGVAQKIEKEFLKSIERNPNSYLYHFWLGELYTFMAEYMDPKYFKNAEDTIKKAMEISPNIQRTPMLLAKNYLIQKDVDSGISVLEELVRKNEDFPEPHWFLGVAYAGRGDDKKGAEEMEKGLAFAGGNPNNVLYLIDIYLKLEDYKKTLPLYQRLIDMNPNDARYYHDIAVIYTVLKDNENAAKNFQEALNRKPDLKEGVEAFLKQYNVKLNIEEKDKN